MSIELPDPIAEKTAGMGEPVALFRTSGLYSAIYLVVGIFFLLLGVGAVLVLYEEIIPPIPGFGVFRLGILVLALLFGGVFVLKKWWNMLESVVVVFSHGLACLRGGKCDRLYWTEIKVVRRGTQASTHEREFTVSTPTRVTLEDVRGKEWTFTEDLIGLKSLRTAIEEMTLDHMLPAALETLEEGNPVPFGAIRVQREGLTYQQMPILVWGLVAGAEIIKGQVVIASTLLKEPYCSVPIREVPNAHLLIYLVERSRSE